MVRRIRILDHCVLFFQFGGLRILASAFIRAVCRKYSFISFRDEKRSKSSHPKGIFFDNDQLANNTELSKSATGLFISEGVGETLECFPSPTVFTPCDDILGKSKGIVYSFPKPLNFLKIKMVSGTFFRLLVQHEFTKERIDLVGRSIRKLARTLFLDDRISCTGSLEQVYLVPGFP